MSIYELLKLAKKRTILIYFSEYRNIDMRFVIMNGILGNETVENNYISMF